MFDESDVPKILLTLFAVFAFSVLVSRVSYLLGESSAQLICYAEKLEQGK